MGSGETGAAEHQWYVLLFPSDEECRRLVAALQPLAARISGQVNDSPHVTVGYFRGTADAQSVIERLRPLDGPCIRVRASGLFALADSPVPLFGWTLALRVWRDAGLRRWQGAVHAALDGSPLVPMFAPGEERLHVRVLQQLPKPSREVLADLAGQEVSLAFVATRMVVTQRIGDRFLDRFEQPLRG